MGMNFDNVNIDWILEVIVEMESDDNGESSDIAQLSYRGGFIRPWMIGEGKQVTSSIGPINLFISP